MSIARHISELMGHWQPPPAAHRCERTQLTSDELGLGQQRPSAEHRCERTQLRSDELGLGQQRPPVETQTRKMPLNFGIVCYTAVAN